MSETTKTSEQPVASAGSHALKIEFGHPARGA